MYKEDRMEEQIRGREGKRGREIPAQKGSDYGSLLVKKREKGNRVLKSV